MGRLKHSYPWIEIGDGRPEGASKAPGGLQAKNIRGLS
jgi:hypothetical protein